MHTMYPLTSSYHWYIAITTMWATYIYVIHTVLAYRTSSACHDVLVPGSGGFPISALPTSLSGEPAEGPALLRHVRTKRNLHVHVHVMCWCTCVIGVYLPWPFLHAKLEFPLFIRGYRDTCLALYCLIRPTTTELPQWIEHWSGECMQWRGFKSHLGQLTFSEEKVSHLRWCCCVSLHCLMRLNYLIM